MREGFDRLLAAVEQLGAVGKTGVLTVTLAPSFAVKWLLPRLDRFEAAHPEIDVASPRRWSWSISASAMSISRSATAPASIPI